MMKGMASDLVLSFQFLMVLFLPGAEANIAPPLVDVFGPLPNNAFRYIGGEVVREEVYGGSVPIPKVPWRGEDMRVPNHRPSSVTFFHHHFARRWIHECQLQRHNPIASDIGTQTSQ